MREAIKIPRSEDEAAAKLKRVLPKLVLMMAGGPRSLASDCVVTAQEMKEIGGLQLHGAIGLPLFIDQKRKSDAGLFAKLAGIDPVSQPDRSECCTFVAKSLYVFAQLRGMLAAKDSSIVAQKNNDSRLLVPQGS